MRSRAAVVFVNYSLSPEVRFPVAIEECYDAVAWVANKENAHSIQVDPHKIIIAGDSAGGYLAAVVSSMYPHIKSFMINHSLTMQSLYKVLAKQRGLTAIKGQALIYPITDSKFDTESYKEFANGYDLTADAMEWFWNHYLPDKEARKNTLASPLQASIEDLRDLPRALVITAEADVLRDEAEAYARKLLAAGNDVVATRYLGIIHGILDIPKAWSPTADAIMDQVANWSKQTWKRT